MNKPSGIGGWLLVFLVVQLLALPVLALKFLVTAYLVGQAPEIPTSLQHLGRFEIGYSVLYGAAAVVGVALLLRRSPRTPRYWRRVLLLVAVAQGMLVVLIFRFLADLPREARGGMDWTILATLLRLAITGLWLAYWFGSERVENTFTPADERRGGPIPSGATAHRAEPPPLPPMAFNLNPPPTPTIDPFRGRPTRTCPQCGQRVLASAEFCRRCKSAIPAAGTG